MQGKQREVYEKMKMDNDYGAIDINGIMASDIVFPYSKPDEEVEPARRIVTSYISGDSFWTHFTNNKTNPKICIMCFPKQYYSNHNPQLDV